jgi:methylase of polypeptide subunit release factors
LVASFSRPGDLIADPFCGAGTIAFEAALAGRRVFASDVSPYAFVLTDAKLNAPDNVEDALTQIEELLSESEKAPPPDLRRVPRWVRAYFNPKTLKEAINFAAVCQKHKHTLGLSCLLGILHHQRPGFLSYPSSHLVPYLRLASFPREQHLNLYGYRPLRPRVINKVIRAYKRVGCSRQLDSTTMQASIEDVILPPSVDAVITSPPYMNALDYGRDNRLRLWFIDPTAADEIDGKTPKSIASFIRVMRILARKVRASLRPGGCCALVVGDAVTRDVVGHTAQATLETFLDEQTFEIVSIVDDVIPDIRRSRRDCRGVKGEVILALRKPHIGKG